MDTLAARLKYVREQVLGVSQAVMATRLEADGGLDGTTNVSVMRYEKGERMPGADFVRAVAQVAGVDPTWLLTGEGVPAASETAEGSATPPGAQSPYDLAREAADLARASAIEDPMLRLLERESVLAVIRTQWGREAAWAARESAWAARLAEQNAARAAEERVRAREKIEELERAHTLPISAYQKLDESDLTTKSR